MDSTLTKGYNPNKLLIAYSPNDFFYANAAELGIMPTSDKCKELNPYDTNWDISCNAQNFPDVSGNCIDKELCKNKDYVDKLLSINKGSSSSDEKYYNIKEEYDTIFMNSINLGIGCLFLFGFIISK